MGTGGAPPMGGPPPPDLTPPPTIGAERSFVTAFFNLAPFSMSPRRAPLPTALAGREGRVGVARLTRPFAAAAGGRLGRLAPLPPGRGGGGGGGPPIVGIGGGGGGGPGMVVISLGDTRIEEENEKSAINEDGSELDV